MLLCRARCSHALNRAVVSSLRSSTRGVGHDLYLVTVLDGRQCRVGDTDLGPEPDHDESVPASVLDFGDVVLVLLCIHHRSIDVVVLREDVENFVE